jgi:serine protease inhibitor
MDNDSPRPKGGVFPASNKAFFGIPGLLFVFNMLFLSCNPVTLRPPDSSNDLTETNGGINEYTAIKIVPGTPKELLMPDGYNPAAAAVADGANSFAFRLGAALAVQNGGAKNLVCSPVSVWIPLAALVNAVDAQYKADLREALGVPGIENEDINNGVSRMLYDLTRQQPGEGGYLPGDYSSPIKTANAVFVDHTVTLKKSFTQTFMDYYRGSSIYVDFESPAAVAEANDWVSKNTGG